jgi:hypothetical protein
MASCRAVSKFQESEDDLQLTSGRDMGNQILSRYVHKDIYSVPRTICSTLHKTGEAVVFHRVRRTI